MDQLQKKQNRVEKKIILKAEAANRIDAWLEQLWASFEGIKVNQHALVNWLVDSHTERLSTNELTAIRETYFDDVARAEWLLHQLKAAKQKGERKSLEDYLSKMTKPEGRQNND